MKNPVWALIALVLGLAVCCGCSFQTPRADVEDRSEYDITLSEVGIPAEFRAKYGEGRMGVADSAGMQRSVFENDMIRIFWIPTHMAMAFRLENKADDSLKIMWGRAEFVEVSGARGEASHGGVRYIEYNYTDKSWQRPSVIPPRGSATDWILPERRIMRAGGDLAGTGDVTPWLEEDPGKYIGKSVTVVLPLKVGERVVDYTFVFSINGLAREE